MENNKQSLLRTIFGMMVNPASAIKSGVFSTKCYLSAAVSSLAFGLFFTQTGLDLYKTGQKGFDFVMLSAATGIIYGIAVIPFIGVIIWLVLKISKSDKDLKTTVSSFCLSYSGALIYGVVGIVFSVVLEWKTSVAFGVTGVLWAVGPIIVTIREMTGGRNVLSIPIATAVSTIVLISWSLFGNI